MDLDYLINRLVELGEDGAELSFWRQAYPDLPSELQAAFLSSLRRELEDLEEIRAIEEGVRTGSPVSAEETKKRLLEIAGRSQPSANKTLLEADNLLKIRRDSGQNNF